MNRITITLNELFSLFEMEKYNYDELISISDDIFVRTPDDDWVPILGFVLVGTTAPELAVERYVSIT